MTPRTGRRRELVEGQKLTLYADGPTAEYLRSLPNASRWVRAMVGLAALLEQLNPDEGLSPEALRYVQGEVMKAKGEG
jgi:hypothetical protein